VTINIQNYNGKETQDFSASAILAMFLGKIKQSVQTTLERLLGGSPEDSELTFVFSMPPDATALTHEQLLDAAHAAGLSSSVLITTNPTASAMTYKRKFPMGSSEEGTQKKNVLIVDSGHAQTTVSVIQFTKQGDKSNDEDGAESSKQPFQVLSSQSSSSLGAGSVDIALWHHFVETLPQLKDVKPKSRGGQRLLQGCSKLKHLLSQLPDGKVVVENVANDADVTISATRTQLSDLCDSHMQSLKSLIESTLQEASIDSDENKLAGVEVLGGGCRIPLFQACIQESLPTEMTLSRSLDDTSAALGAALVGEETAADDLLVPLPEVTEALVARREQLRNDELAMEALDMEQKTISSLRNRIESQVLELRSAKHAKHGKLLPGNLDSTLDTMDDWLFSPESEEASLEAVEAKWKEFSNQTSELCRDYVDAVEADEQSKAKEMEEEAKRAQAEKGDDEDDNDDHDNRRLPKKRRMEIVMKNKEEANELFKDGNYKFAAARYTKALGHCGKFVDLSPDDEEEVQTMKVTLNLNLALAYTKLQNWDQALRVCNDALALDANNTKALYRRGAVYYEKRKFDEAKADVKKAMKNNSEDKALKKLSDRIDAQLKRQKDKEKKMAAKMFG